MSKNHKYLKQKAPLPLNQKKTIVILCAAIAVVLVIIIALLFSMLRSDPAPTEPTEAETTEATAESTEEATEETLPPETEPEMLPHMKELYEQNDEIIGWVQIEGTKIDYPVMWTPDEKWKYDHLDFNENYSFPGVPYLNESCSVDKPTTNLIIYGHNMLNGTQFRGLHDYATVLHWEKHPIIKFTTLYEEREYEILAAMYDRIYLKTEDCFKYYYFIDPQTEEEFNEGIQYFKDHSLYDTGVDAEWGDQLITLVTCSYHVDDGRFVVVARLIEDEAVEEETVPAT